MEPNEAVDRTFLALVVWREARGEPDSCKVAVAYSILNRVERPSWWGRDILSVVTKKWQYSSMTAPGDPNLVKWPTTLDPSWIACLDVVWDVMEKKRINLVPGADSYYDISIPPPDWATKETFVAQVGRIRFHNLDRDVEA